MGEVKFEKSELHKTIFFRGSYQYPTFGPVSLNLGEKWGGSCRGIYGHEELSRFHKLKASDLNVGCPIHNDCSCVVRQLTLWRRVVCRRRWVEWALGRVASKIATSLRIGRRWRISLAGIGRGRLRGHVSRGLVHDWWGLGRWVVRLLDNRGPLRLLLLWIGLLIWDRRCACYCGISIGIVRWLRVLGSHCRY